MARWVSQRWHETLRDGSNPSVETKWQLLGDDDLGSEYDILAARVDLLAALPATAGNLPLTDIEIERQGASGNFDATVNYGMRQIPEDGKFEFTMDSRPESRRVFMALSTVNSYAPSGRTPPNQSGYLNVNSDLQPTGTDIYLPVKTYSVSVWWATSRFVSGQSDDNYKTLQAYLDLLETLEGKVNDTLFTFVARGLTFKFQTGECLFAGSRLSQQGADLWQIDLELKKKLNYVDPLLTAWNGSNVTVQGWDEVDFPSVGGVDNDAKVGVPVPGGGIIKRNYFRDDLNKLKVPTPP